ncbi:hypothetical protein PSCICJ_29290 [Pseudomonas cichorii]|nr:hypothetical protein PSCICJ_29290 [Pseudomonas cichorii]
MVGNEVLDAILIRVQAQLGEQVGQRVGWQFHVISLSTGLAFVLYGSAGDGQEFDESFIDPATGANVCLACRIVPLSLSLIPLCTKGMYAAGVVCR